MRPLPPSVWLSIVLGHLLALPVVAQQLGSTEDAVVYAAEVPAGDTLMLTVTGTVTVAEKNFLGQIKALQISSDVGSFRIAADSKGQELLDYVGRRVTITAERATDSEGNVVLAVRSYEPGKS